MLSESSKRKSRGVKISWTANPLWTNIILGTTHSVTMIPEAEPCPWAGHQIRGPFVWQCCTSSSWRSSTAEACQGPTQAERSCCRCRPEPTQSPEVGRECGAWQSAHEEITLSIQNVLHFLVRPKRIHLGLFLGRFQTDLACLCLYLACNVLTSLMIEFFYPPLKVL